MENVCVSIIMPVYNVEKYLKRAVNSVLSQKFSDFEIILSDDGSIDNSGRICDELAEQNRRITAIHKENGGVSTARNAALKIARGEYIYFMDPDDYLVGELLEENIGIAQKYGCDQVIFSFRSEICDSGDNVLKRVDYFHGMDGVRSYEEFKNEFLLHLTNVHQVVWNRLYRKSSIEGVYFSERIATAEDAIFNLELIKKGFGNIYYNNKIYYSYMCRENSLMNKYNPKRFDNETMITDAVKEIVNAWGREKEFEEYLSYRYVESMLAEYSNMSMKSCTLKTSEVVRKLRGYYNDERVYKARKIILPKDMPHIALKATYFLSDKNMFKTALYFRKIYTVCSRTVHKILKIFKK